MDEHRNNVFACMNTATVSFVILGLGKNPGEQPLSLWQPAKAL